MARTRAALKSWEKVDLRLLPGTTEGDILNALRRRYNPPEWAFLPHLRPGTGWSSTRTADGFAMNLWPSRGLELHGFEVKVSRSDWFRELRNPAKADEMAAYCDRWWIVVADLEPSIIQPGELPAPWGLIVFDGKGLCYEKEAGKLEATPLDRTFIAAMMRRTQESLGHEASIELAVAEAEKRIRDELAGQVPYEVERVKDDLRELRQQVDEFEAASGVTLDRWSSGKRIGEAVKMVLASSGPIAQLRKLHEQLGRVVSEAEDLPDEATP
jgi:hypothetical protein